MYEVKTENLDPVTTAIDITVDSVQIVVDVNPWELLVNLIENSDLSCLEEESLLGTLAVMQAIVTRDHIVKPASSFYEECQRDGGISDGT